MQEGWNERPEKRFSPQMIFSKLIMARELRLLSFNYYYHYYSIKNNEHDLFGFLFVLQVKPKVIPIQLFIGILLIISERIDQMAV